MPGTDTITIKGKEFVVPLKYSEGDVLTAGEASALNQTFHENIRNNLAKKVETGEADQATVDAYASTYQFGVRAPGGVRASADPVHREAMKLAVAAIKARLKEQNKEAAKEQIAELAEKLAKDDSRPFLTKAREIVKAQNEAAAISLDGFMDAA